MGFPRVYIDPINRGKTDYINPYHFKFPWTIINQFEPDIAMLINYKVKHGWPNE